MCQRDPDVTQRFQVAILSGECKLKVITSFETLKLDGQSVIYTVGKDCRISTARFLTAKSTNDVWKACRYTWIAPYRRYLDTLSLDQGQQFSRTEWLHITSVVGIFSIPFGVEIHNSIGVSEVHHAYLCRIYDRVVLSAPLLPRKLVLVLWVKVAHDIAGPFYLVLSLLVYDIMPQMSDRPKDLPGHVEKLQFQYFLWKRCKISWQNTAWIRHSNDEFLMLEIFLFEYKMNFSFFARNQ